MVLSWRWPGVSTQLEPGLEAIRVPRPRRGRPRTRPDHLIGDKGYSYPRCRRAHRPGRKPAFDREVYRRRNVVERGINRLKQFRTIATRYAKRATTYRAMVVIASILIWIGQ